MNRIWAIQVHAVDFVRRGHGSDVDEKKPREIQTVCHMGDVS